MFWGTSRDALTAPRHPKAYIDRYKGKFDKGWDWARETILDKQIALGVVPKGTKLTKRAEGNSCVGQPARGGTQALRSTNGSLCRSAHPL